MDGEVHTDNSVTVELRVLGGLGVELNTMYMLDQLMAWATAPGGCVVLDDEGKKRVAAWFWNKYVEDVA